MGKSSCKRTVLNRCTQTESRWNKQKPSRSTPEHAVMRLPSSHKRLRAVSLRKPCVSMAIGWKVYCDGRLKYLASLRVAEMLRRLTLVPMPRHSRQSCKWQSHPKLPACLLPRNKCHAIWGRRFPSTRLRPAGSFKNGKQAIIIIITTTTTSGLFCLIRIIFLINWHHVSQDCKHCVIYHFWYDPRFELA